MRLSWEMELLGIFKLMPSMVDRLGQRQEETNWAHLKQFLEEQETNGWRPLIGRKILLGCGVLSSLLYAATDVLATLRYPSYRYMDQAFSELTAAGAPTRPLLVALNVIPYDLLVAAFAVGVGTSTAPKRSARITPALLVGYAAVGGVTGLVFPMTPRGTKGTLSNLIHIPGTAVMSLCLVLAMGFGATLLGKRFRFYTYAKIVIVPMFGILTSL
jgi:hypothetical protein